MRHLHAGKLLDQRRGNVSERAVAGMADIDLARILLGIGDQVGERLHRKVWYRRDDQWRLGDEHDRHEIPLGVVSQALVHELVERDRRRRPEQPRMAVGSRLGDRRPTEIAARARTVFDDELLAEVFTQRMRNGARKGINGGAGRERHDHGNRMVRPLLRHGVVPWRNGKCEAQQAEREQAHVSSELCAGLALAPALILQQTCPGPCGPAIWIIHPQRLRY